MDLENKLASLLAYDETLTISKTDDGFMIAFADAEMEGEDLLFVPSVVLTTKATLAEAIFAFDAYQSMTRVRGYQA